MNPHIPQVAVPGVPVPMPVVVQVLAHEWLLRGRAAPEIVIAGRRDGLRAVDPADTHPRLIIDSIDARNFSELAGPDVFEGFGNRAAVSRAVNGLDHAMVLAHGLDHFAALEEIVRRGLLHEHVFSRLAGHDRHEGMPVIRRRNRDGVDVFVVQNLAKVRARLDFLAPFAELVHFIVQMIPVAVANGRDANARNLAEVPDIASSLTPNLDKRSDPDHADANIIIGPEDSRRR